VASSSLTAKRRLADALLDGGLVAYVSSRRASGESWRQISWAIREEVDLDIHPHTIRAWTLDDEPSAVAS
jgi:hypothetical protein